MENIFIFLLKIKRKKNNLLKFSISKNEKKLKLEKNYNIDYNDLSGMTFYKNELYIVSDKNDIYLIYDLKNKKIKYSEKLLKGNWEGITFDKKGEIFLADDSGSVLKFLGN